MNTEHGETLGKLVKSSREQKGWSQTELAKRSRVALRTIVNVENSQATRRIRFDVVIRLALALELSPRKCLDVAGHSSVSDEMISQVAKKAEISNFYGEDDPMMFFKHLEELIQSSAQVIVSMTYCTYSKFAHQETLASKIAPLINGGKLFLALVCAYPRITDLDNQQKPTLSRIYLEVRNEVIGLAKAVKENSDSAFRDHVAAFSPKALPYPICFPQVGLSQFRQILIQSRPLNEKKQKFSAYELSTWITFFQDQKERWIRIYPTPEIWKTQEDDYRKICSAWRDYLTEIHNNCDPSHGWSKGRFDAGAWEMAGIA